MEDQKTCAVNQETGIAEELSLTFSMGKAITNMILTFFLSINFIHT